MSLDYTSLDTGGWFESDGSDLVDTEIYTDGWFTTNTSVTGSVNGSSIITSIVETQINGVIGSSVISSETNIDYNIYGSIIGSSENSANFDITVNFEGSIIG